MVCFECYRDTLEYKKAQKPIKSFIKQKISDYYNEKIPIELKCSDYLYYTFKKYGYYRENSKNVYFKGKNYRIVFPYKYTPCYPKYNESLKRLEYFTCIRLKFNGINIRELIESILEDFKHVATIGMIIRFCQDIIKYFKNLYTFDKSGIKFKKTKSSEMVFALSKSQSKSYKNQLVDLIFNEGNIDFLWYIAEQNLDRYKMEVYGLLDCIGNDFHKLEKNYYFNDNGYLELLEYHLRNNIEFNRELKGKFINLRFDCDKLVVKFNRRINRKIRCYGFSDKVLDDFIAIGISELYSIFAYYGISIGVFENNTTAENYTRFHLAKKIRCNIEIEQPELLNRLIDKVGKEKESLSYLGLDNYKHCIDYSFDAEYEILFNDINGVSLDKIKRDLIPLEKVIRPKQQSIDKYLDKNIQYYNPKYFILLKKYLPIPAFSIESNPIKNVLPYFERNHNEIQDFIDFSLLAPKINKIKNHKNS